MGRHGDMELSASTLMLALKAVQLEIKRHQAALEAPDLSDEDADYHGDYILDLTKALSELSSAYESARQGDQALPSADDLLAHA